MIPYSLLNTLCRDKICGVMATVVSSDGQGPARGGDCLFWSQGERVAGTVGGGANEQQVLQACADLVGEQQIVDISSPLSGVLPSCGGTLRVQLDRVDFARDEDVAFWQKRQQNDQRSRLFLLGAGHVVQEVAWLAHRNEFQIVIVDPRRELMRQENFPALCTRIPETNSVFFEKNTLKQDDFIVIAGPDHGTDLRALEQAAQTPVHYIGLMGSTRKISSFEEILRAKNLWDTLAGRLYAPIGISIPSRKPAEVAISIMAQLIQIRAQSCKKQ